MCGIVGSAGDALPSEGTLHAMANALRHRGPDEGGFFRARRVCLAMRRLSIIDVAHGHQPMANEDESVVLVFNGEIYNYQELRAELERSNHRFKTASDSEVLLRGYEEWGTALLSRLRGMFAFAIWDAEDQSLLLARDRLGKKPLYYWPTSDSLHFASEIKALRQLEAFPSVVDRQALSLYLALGYVPRQFSIYADVHKVLPGHFLRWRRGQIESREYWRPMYPENTQSPLNLSHYCETLRDRLLDATAIRLNSERPIGAFLSGGLDSSAVVAAAAQLQPHPIQTFSVGFDGASNDELPYARQVADRYGTQHTEIVVKPATASMLAKIASMFDEPYADSSALPSWQLAYETRRNVVVALNGDGGDEAFGGYTRYPQFARIAGFPALLPQTAQLVLADSLRAKRNSILRRAGTALQTTPDWHRGKRYGRFMSLFSPREIARLSPEFAAGTAEAAVRLYGATWDECTATDDLSRMLYSDQMIYLPGDLLPKVDITTMDVSLEARSPLLDHQLVEWAATIPPSLKINNNITKFVFKRAMEPWLPREVIYRPKRGFSIPLDGWLRGPWRPIAWSVLTDAAFVRTELLDPQPVRRLLRAQDRGADHGSRIFALLMLALWATTTAADRTA